MALINTMSSHSGFRFPITPNPFFHDFHHQYFDENYGVLGILDYLHGSSVKYRALRDKAARAEVNNDDEVPVKTANFGSNPAKAVTTSTRGIETKKDD
jgi:sterol desaturase/sphingolipid hydroxylase (fatty acid hydroxylase superfamily)